MFFSEVTPPERKTELSGLQAENVVVGSSVAQLNLPRWETHKWVGHPPRIPLNHLTSECTQTQHHREADIQPSGSGPERDFGVVQ